MQETLETQSWRGKVRKIRFKRVIMSELSVGSLIICKRSSSCLLICSEYLASVALPLSFGKVLSFQLSAVACSSHIVLGAEVYRSRGLCCL